MPEDDSYTIVPLAEHGFFWIRFRGEISLDRLARGHDAFTSHPDYSANIDELLDFTQSSIKGITNTEIDVIRAYMTRKSDRHHCKSAIVVSRSQGWPVWSTILAAVPHAKPLHGCRGHELDPKLAPGTPRIHQLPN